MAQRRQTPWVWLVVAVVLLAAGAWIMRGAEPPERPPPAPVELPWRMSERERQRAEERRTWLAPVAFDAGVVAPPQRPKDPVLALMPPELKRGAVVAEFNAIMNSELGGLMADCLFGDGPFMQELRDAGLDPSTSIDRVAMVDDSMVVTGNFQGAGWRRFLPERAVSKGYGRQGELIEVSREDGGVETFAAWGGQMFIGGGTEAEQKAILDRLEGGGPAQRPALDDSMAYGEVYGVVNASTLAQLIGTQDERLGQVIGDTAKAVQLHMDVSHDVGLVADVDAKDAQKTEELRRSLGSALSLARMQAAAKGKRDEADLLDLARVKSAHEGNAFRLEAGVPHDYMKKVLVRCAADRKARQARRGAARDGAGEAEGP
jgi:hypothetical protein